MNKKRLYLLSLMISALAVVIPFTGCAGATTQDIVGAIQAIDGKTVVLTTQDGSTVRIQVTDDKLAAEAGKLVGEHVQVQARGDNLEMAKIERIGEDRLAMGVIQSIGAGVAVIDGQTYKVVGATMLDGGLVPGAIARVEFVTMPDGSRVAKEIETDKALTHATGAIQSIKDDMVVIGGNSFKVSPHVSLDDRITPGAQGRVSFVTLPDGTLLATRLEPEIEDEHVSGKIEAVRASEIVIGGKSIQINPATFIERGMGAGAMVRAEVIRLSDNTLLATRIEVDKSQRETEREQELEKREQELRGREDQLRSREAEIRGREAEIRGQEPEARGRAAEGETQSREAEARGRAAEGETEIRGQEAEAGRGGEAEAGRGGPDVGGDTSGGGGADDSGGGSGGGGG